MLLSAVRKSFHWVIAAALTSAVLPAMAQERPISLIVAYQAGGGQDVIARALARVLQPVLDQPIVVENITGAGSRIAHQTLTRSNPDGLRLMLTNTDITINQALRSSPPWNMAKDFTHIAVVGNSAIVYLTNTQVPAKTLGEFVSYARDRAKKGDPVPYGSSGIGSILHLTVLELTAKYGVDLLHVPYRGAAPAIQDLSGGQIAFASVSPINAVGREDKLRPLAITGTKRHPMLPSVPTTAEAGFGELDTSVFLELVGPPNMPPATTQRIVDALKKAVATDAFRSGMLAAGIEPTLVTGAELQTLLQNDLKKWQELHRSSGVTLDD